MILLVSESSTITLFASSRLPEKRRSRAAVKGNWEIASDSMVLESRLDVQMGIYMS